MKCLSLRLVKNTDLFEVKGKQTAVSLQDLNICK